MRKIYWLLVFIAIISLCQAQKRATSSNEQIRTYLTQHRSAILQEFQAFLALPNLANDEANIQKNADALMQMLKKRGLQSRLLKVEHAPPVVLAETPVDPSKRTVTFYAHYDGQPVDRSQWKQDPWKPTLVGRNSNNPNPNPNGPDTRIYARSSSDDKAAVFGLITAFDAMQASHLPVSVNLRFFFEGEEEAGSPHLPAILSKYANELQSDMWVICDGPTNQNGAPQLTFGSRGVVTVQITAFGPVRPLHSGHYGNWAPNPIVELAYLISKLRNTEGEITIPNFYAPVRPLTPGEQKALKDIPNIDDQLRTEFGLGRTEGHGALAEQVLKPGLNLDRIEGGGTGPNPANAIPSSATAYIDLRLVPDQTPEIVRNQLEGYLRNLGYFLTEKPPAASELLQHPKLLQVTWGAGYAPQRTPIDAPASQAFIQAARTVTGNALVLMPTLGGSTPSSVFEQQFKKPIIGLPIANYDNNQHAANENLKLKNFWDGIALYAGIFGTLGEYWK